MKVGVESRNIALATLLIASMNEISSNKDYKDKGPMM
jgi:hypothetical protein